MEQGRPMGCAKCAVALGPPILEALKLKKNAFFGYPRSLLTTANGFWSVTD